MNIAITGHRIQKLQCYNQDWIKYAIYISLFELKETNHIHGYSGMASGVDLWFCNSCNELGIRYDACVPFKEQDETMSPEDAKYRLELLGKANAVLPIRNSAMLEYVDMAFVVWDGNKGGTHNVLQQLIEKKVPFLWINPVWEKTWECF